VVTNKRQRKKRFGEPRRFGFTEKQLRRMSSEQQEAIIKIWFPLRRAVYPKLISEGLITVEEKK
jgi:hypothetical protein